MKRDTLYTINSWNKNLLSPKGDVFDDGGRLESLASEYFAKHEDAFNKDSKLSPVDQYLNTKNFLGISKRNNPFSKANFTKEAGTALLSAAAPVVGQAAYQGLSNGLSSGLGSGINSFGTTAGSIASKIDPRLGAGITALSGIVGGVTNNLMGHKLNQENINLINKGISALGTVGRKLGNAQSNDDVLSAWGATDMGTDFTNGFIGRDGRFSSKARRKAESLRRQQEAARVYAVHSMGVGAENADQNMDDNIMANFNAGGGPLDFADTDMGSAIQYDFMKDYWRYKDKQISSKDRADNMNILGSIGYKGLYALGGDVQTHGGDFSTGMTRINAGGSHESNPNDGVQMGVDGEGVPNLLEEGEVVFNDFVYSRRIMVNDEVKKRFHLPKKKEMSYADVAKKLEKEFAERPNDPISKAAFKKQMEELAQMQEEQKKEMEVERARQAFEALSDEEKLALIQQQEAQEQAAMQQQAMAEQQMAAEQGIVPAEGLEAQPQVAVMPAEAVQGGQPMMAEGGNLYATAGPLKNAGTWKEGDSASNWGTFTRKGLEDYLNGIIERINAAESDEEKNAIRQEAIDAVGGIQQAYRKAYQNSLTPSEWNADVEALQKAFQAKKGNAYFGNIADAINLPVGANTMDREGTWVDGYWGPRTSIRNWGSTEYGDADYYKNIADLANKAGLVYAPNEEWAYGENGANKLYGLSLMNPAAGPETVVTPESGAGTRMAAPADGSVYHDPDFAPNGKNGPRQVDTGEGTVTENPEEIVPKHKWEALRYAGLFGPAIGLGLNLAGVGKPNFAGLDAAVSIGSGPAHLAEWMPRGDFAVYRSDNPFYYRNPIIEQANATQKAIDNTASPVRWANTLANSRNAMIALGKATREGLENDFNKYMKVKDYNANIYESNAQRFDRNSQFNADALNRHNQLNAQLQMDAAKTKMAADAGWYNSIYGNIAGFTKGLGELGRENKEYNMFVDLLGTGAIPVTPQRLVDAGLYKYKQGAPKYSISKNGGKIGRRKGRRGLTF